MTLLAPGAEARVVYPAAQTLSAADQNATAPQVAVDPQGRATVVWSRFDGNNWRTQVVRLGANGVPGPIQALSAAGRDARRAQVAVDSQGRATAVWERQDDSSDNNWRIETRRYRPNGMGPVDTLSMAGEDALLPQVAIDSQDRATVVWSRFDGPNRRIQAMRLTGGSPGTVQTLTSSGQDARTPQVAIDSQDRAQVVWGRSDGTNLRVQATRLLPTGAPGLPVWTLSPEGNWAFAPRVAIDSQDRATVVWSLRIGGLSGSSERIQAIRLGADGELVAGPQFLTDSGAGPVAQVAVDSQNRATVVWTRNVGGTVRVQSRRLGADTSPGPLQEFSTAVPANDPQVAIDSQDRATVVWQSFHGSNLRVQAIRLGSDGAPFAVQTLSAAGQSAGEPQVAIDSQGRATVVWERSDGTNVRIEAARGEIVAPDTQITSGPANGSTIATAFASFSFTGSPTADVDRFQCRIDSGSFVLCSSPNTIGPLADGPHTFAVRAVDVEGDADPTPAQRSFTVDTTPPPDPPPPDGGTPPPDGGTPPPDGGTPSPGNEALPPPATDSGTFPAKLKLRRASIIRGRLDVLARITARATGRVRVTYHSAGRRIRFTAPITRRHGIRFSKLLPRAQRRTTTGILAIEYAGNERVRPESLRLRAANRRAELRIGTPVVHAGRLVLGGTTSRLARGVVRLALSYEDANGRPATFTTKARIRNGRWRVSAPLPAAAAAGGGYLSVQFTGYIARRIRGEQDARSLSP